MQDCRTINRKKYRLMGQVYTSASRAASVQEIVISQSLCFMLARVLMITFTLMLFSFIVFAVSYSESTCPCMGLPPSFDVHLVTDHLLVRLKKKWTAHEDQSSEVRLASRISSFALHYLEECYQIWYCPLPEFA